MGRLTEMLVKSLLCLLMLCFVLLPPARGAQTPLPAPADRAAVAEGGNAFAVELYGHLRKQSGNLFFSPESISTALAMAYAGARGDTASSMAKTLHFTLPPDRLNPAMGALLSDLNAVHEGYQLSVANALWAQRGYTFLNSFLNLMNNDYGAGLNQVDFKGSTEAARLTINQWVEQKTANKIKDLLPAGALKPPGIRPRHILNGLELPANPVPQLGKPGGNIGFQGIMWGNCAHGTPRYHACGGSQKG